MIGFHMQGNVDDWPDAVRRLPEGTPVKVIDGVQRCVEAKANNPDVYTVVRHHVHEQNPAGDKHQKAREFFASFVDDTFRGLARHVDAVQEWNEYYANSQSQAEKDTWNAWASACVDVWRDEYRTQSDYAHIDLILAETAIGNDIPVELAKLSHENRPWVILGYHPYVPVWKGDIRPDDWQYYSGRWEAMDQQYRNAGYRVRWFFGEFGAVGHNGPGWPNSLAANDGWKHRDVYNGDINAYLGMMEYWLDRTIETDAWKRGDVLGATIFTSGGGDLWRWFELAQPHLNTVADFVNDYMANVDKPPPPPLPDPGELVNGSFEDGWTDQSMTAQKPNGWTLDIAHSGDVRGNEITGGPECVHRYGPDPKYDDVTLPPDEWIGGENALVLDGTTCYKMFTQAVWSASLRQTVSGLEPGTEATLIVPANIHFDGRGDVYDADDTLLKISLNGQFIERWMTKEQDRTWVYSFVEAVVPADGNLHVEIEASVKWAHPTAFFFDAIQLDFDVDPPPPEPDCKGLPREQYKRRSLVVPQNISKTDWLAVAQTAYENKNTVGFSYDDAGVGDLDSKTAVLYGIPTANRQTFIDWYTEHYPGTVVLFGAYGEPMPVGVFVDVSHNNGVMDWSKAKAEGVTHAYIKATDWSGRDPWKDPEFDRNWAEAKSVGIQRGAYHFYRNYADPTEQAMSFLEVLGDDHGELPAALDVEDDSPTDANDLWSWLLMVEEALQATPVIYTAAWIWNKWLDGTAWASDYALWVANWTTANEPLIPDDWAANGYWLWQYDNKGDCKQYGGTSRYIDLNRFG